MATTHVLIVDLETFQYHLEYQFLGTGAKDYVIDFNDISESTLKPAREKVLASMIADGMRIRRGDLIIFYLQQNLQKKVLEGKFYGLFRAKNDWIFLDNNDQGQFLANELGKSLTFRSLIEPYEVYPEGVTEWEALDEIKCIHSPHQMLWSLIYRKLKGNRGNTMITPYEAERLIHLLRRKNSNNTVPTSLSVTFNKDTQCIGHSEREAPGYNGRMDTINILPRLRRKVNDRKACESHLQAYIIQNVGLNIHQSLDRELLIDGYKLSWRGNEVSCGVGMQRIDILIEMQKDGVSPHRIIVPIELKYVKCKKDNIRQIKRYVSWLEQYYVPNRPCEIQPILIGPEQEKNLRAYIDLRDQLISYNTENENRIKPIKYIEFSVNDGWLNFETVDYQ